MSDISKITLPSGDEYNLKDSRIAFCTCNTVAAESEKVCTVTNNVSFTLSPGAIVGIKFTYTNTAKNVTYNVNNTGAKPLYYGSAVSTAATNSFTAYANRVYFYMYDGEHWVLLSNGIVNADTYTRINANVAIVKAEYAIDSTTIIVAGSNGLYHELSTGNPFDLKYPILYTSGAIAAGATSTATYICIAFTITKTQSITLDPQEAVYIKGTLSGSTFTPVSTTPITQTVPTSADGYEYILLGYAYSATAMYLWPEHPIFVYQNGAFSMRGGDSVGLSNIADAPNYGIIEGNIGQTTSNSNIASGQYAHAEGDYTKAEAKGSHSEGGSTIASGLYSHAEGTITRATGTDSHAEGGGTTASGTDSHAEGGGTTASGNSSHAEGSGTHAYGKYSHAEGGGTTAGSSNGGNYAHAEGVSTTASGEAAHAEGTSTTASGDRAHAEGVVTIAWGGQSHSEGSNTKAYGSSSHAEGTGTTTGKQNSFSDGQNAHAEGNGTTALGTSSHAEGGATLASGEWSHAEGNGSKAYGEKSHAEGNNTVTGDQNDSTKGTYAHAEGNGTTASGESSHAEGDSTTASGQYAHAEGYAASASGQYSHAEGGGTTASGNYSHAEGCVTTALDHYSHAEGSNTTAGYCAHAEGYITHATGSYSHAEGRYNTAKNLAQHVFGEYCITDSSNPVAEQRGIYVEIVGNGTDDDARSNARTLDWDGNETLSGSVTVGGSTGGTIRYNATTNAMDFIFS